jgi:Ca2+-binding RTX toxin-like protein
LTQGYASDESTVFQGWKGFANTFYGYGGDDNLSGADLNDFFDGGSGNDTLFGFEGDDKLFGAEGEDWLNGGIGNDYLVGGVGRDNLYGREGDDVYVISKQDGEDIIEDNGG